MTGGLKKSAAIQKIANTKDTEELKRAAVLWKELDVEDCTDDVGSFFDGFKDGIEIVIKYPGQDIYLVEYPVYSDNDGMAFFVGSQREIIKTLRALPDKREF